MSRKIATPFDDAIKCGYQTYPKLQVHDPVSVAVFASDISCVFCAADRLPMSCKHLPVPIEVGSCGSVTSKFFAFCIIVKRIGSIIPLIPSRIFELKLSSSCFCHLSLLNSMISLEVPKSRVTVLVPGLCCETCSTRVHHGSSNHTQKKCESPKTLTFQGFAPENSFEKNLSFDIHPVFYQGIQSQFRIWSTTFAKWFQNSLGWLMGNLTPWINCPQIYCSLVISSKMMFNTWSFIGTSYKIIYGLSILFPY